MACFARFFLCINFLALDYPAYATQPPAAPASSQEQDLKGGAPNDKDDEDEYDLLNFPTAEEVEKTKKDLELELKKTDQKKIQGLSKLLKNMSSRKQWSRFYGAVNAYASCPKDGFNSSPVSIHDAFSPKYWLKSLPGQNIQEMFLFSNQVDAWLKDMLAQDQKRQSPAVLIFPSIRVDPRSPINIPPNPEIEKIIFDTMAQYKPLAIYIPISAQPALDKGGTGHLILAKITLTPTYRLQPSQATPIDPNNQQDQKLTAQNFQIIENYFNSNPNAFQVQFDFYDSLKSGRTVLFSPEEEKKFVNVFWNFFEQLAPQKKLMLDSQPKYNVVGTQLPGLTSCGRYVTLYMFLDILGIPYDEWTFNLIEPRLAEFIQIFEGK